MCGGVNGYLKGAKVPHRPKMIRQAKLLTSVLMTFGLLDRVVVVYTMPNNPGYR
jgi:hypothetical protein